MKITETPRHMASLGGGLNLQTTVEKEVGQVKKIRGDTLWG